MWHEISQYDIPDRQLLTTKAQTGVSRWKDLGEAKITHTIFGKARVRIIREQDKIRRARFLAALAVAALAAAAWQGWAAMNRTTVPPLSARIQVSAPAFQPEYLPNASAPSPVGSKTGASSQTGIIDRVTGQKSSAQQVPGLKVSEQITVKSDAPKALIASKPQTASLAGNSNPEKNPAGLQQSPVQPAPVRPAKSVVKTPISMQPAANSAAASTQPPLVKGITSASSPAGDNQPAGPVKAQVK